MRSVLECSPVPSKQLTARQELAVRALLTAPTREAAAKAAGISTVTLWRFMKQPEFRDACHQARREAVEQTATQLQRSSLEAVKILDAIAANEAASPTARVSAAKAILQMSFRAVQSDDLTLRLEALEDMTRELETP